MIVNFKPTTFGKKPLILIPLFVILYFAFTHITIQIRRIDSSGTLPPTQPHDVKQTPTTPVGGTDAVSPGEAKPVTVTVTVPAATPTAAKPPTLVFPEIPDSPLEISQWGERGSRIRQLAHWADMLMQSQSENTTAFEAALVKQFPFLGGGVLETMYRPWSTPHAQSESASSEHGFVICAGSGNYQLAAHLIRSLRRVYKSSSLVEVAYAGDEDLQPKHREFLAALEPNVTFIDLLQRFPDAEKDLKKSGWAMKPFALLASNHSRTILMDADALFLASPEALFEKHPALKKTGTLFFHDRAATGGDEKRLEWVKAAIRVAGLSPSKYLTEESLFYSGAAWYEQDSGVVAVDRSNPRVMLGMIFATWMNTKEVREKITYEVFYGDKETFWLAMELCGFDYSFQPMYAGTVGTVTMVGDQPPSLESEVEICGKHMLHLDYTGQIPFWMNGGIYEDKGAPEKGFAKMSHYWVGNTSEIRLTQPNWYWHAGNVACLKEKGVKELSEESKDNVKRTWEEAQKVDEMIRNIDVSK